MTDDKPKHAGGPWPAGTSGNPAGRARALGPDAPTVKELRARLGQHLPELLDRMLLQAMSGDTTAQRLLIERVLPSLKAESMPVQVQLPDGRTIADTAKALLDAALAGNLAPDVARELLDGLSKVTTVAAVEELKVRLLELERLA